MSYKVPKRGANARHGSGEFVTFEDLDVYKAAREFGKSMYAVNRRLPDLEKYDLGRQIRRAAVSLTNNIAEGHGRFHYRDRIRFFLHSRGSLEELVDDLNICLDEKYVPADHIANLKEQSLAVLTLINGYLRYYEAVLQACRNLTRQTAKPSKYLKLSTCNDCNGVTL
jgi:four helix bundle protein